MLVELFTNGSIQAYGIIEQAGRPIAFSGKFDWKLFRVPRRTANIPHLLLDETT